MSELEFLADGGDMGARIRAFDWQRSSLGPPSGWPPALRTTLRILLTTHHPVFIFWGPDHICFYNDAYSRSLGPEKHPAILGAPGSVAWPEIWPIIGPQIEQVMSGRGATWHENHLVPIFRHGRVEEVYWTYSYGPIDDTAAPHGIGGVLVLCSETTQQVLAEQRIRAAERRWRELLDDSPGFACVLSGPEHRIDYANRRFEEMVGEDRVPRGARILDTLPEWGAQGILAPLDEVYRTGEPFGASATPVAIRGKPRQFVDLVFQPLRDAAANVTGVCIAGFVVTDLVVLQDQLRRADRKKDEFLATLAHELRGPLAPIRNVTQIVRSPAAAAAAREWSAGVIERQVRTMARLLDDLLDISRVTRGVLALRRQRVGLESLVDAAVEVAQSSLEARQHALTLSLPPEPIELDVDPVRMAQVLSNLLINAAKYTDTGGAIALEVRFDPPALRFEVSDNGIGLSPESLDGVFGMFSQVEDGAARSLGGLGIGLALVKGLVTLHGGQVSAHSEGLGRGSRFVVTLPATAVVAAGATAFPAVAAAGDRRVSRRVLVAPDADESMRQLELLLRESGHEVQAASGGVEALRTAAEFRPHVAILDLAMQALDAYDVARAFRAQRWGRDIKLIALTDAAAAADPPRAFDAGFDHQLAKPVDLSVLEACWSLAPGS